MSTLDDLRTTLERHADGLHDAEQYARPVAVRTRIRAARRRRAGTVAVAAALVVVAGSAVVGALRTTNEVQPADRVVVGIDVPGEIDVLDFPYALRETTELGGGDPLRVDAEGEQAVILVGNGLGLGSATLLRDGVAVARLVGGEQIAVPFPLGDGESTIRVRLDGTPDDARAGVALYEATGELAPGVDNGTAVFRDTYAGQPLLGAAFSRPGESSVEFEADGARSMRFVFYCDGPGDLWVNIDIDGEPGMATSCGAGAATDLSAGSAGTLDDMDLGAHDVRVYVTRDAEGPPVDVDDVSVGAGVYAAADTVEYAGRTWRLAEERLPSGGSTTVDTTDGDRLLEVAGRGDLGLTWSGRLGDGGSVGSVKGEGSTLAGVLLAGDVYQVRANDPDSRIRVYRPE